VAEAIVVSNDKEAWMKLRFPGMLLSFGGGAMMLNEVGLVRGRRSYKKDRSAKFAFALQRNECEVPSQQSVSSPAR